MKTQFHRFFLVLAVFPLGMVARAEEEPLKLDLKHLETQAVETVTITIDKQLLAFAINFLPKDAEGQEVRDLVKGLDLIMVRNLKFDRAGTYSASDVERVRQQLAGPGWSQMVEVRGKENVNFYVKKKGEKIQGFTILSAKPREFTVVSIQGDIRPEQLNKLEGFGGIPHDLWNANKPPAGNDRTNR